MSILSQPPSASSRSTLRSARGLVSLVGAAVTLWLLLKAFRIYSVPIPPAAGPASLDGYAARPFDREKQGLGFTYELSPEELEKEQAQRLEEARTRTTTSKTSLKTSSPSTSSSPSMRSSSTFTTSMSVSSAAPVSYPPGASNSSASATIATTIVSTDPAADPLDSTATAAADTPLSTSDLLTTSDEFEIVEDTEDSQLTESHPDNFGDYTTTIVVGRLDKDPAGVKWIHDNLKDITRKAIYIVDDPNAPLHLDRNKGREAMVYLKYIIEHYDKLSDVNIFFHSSRMAWHNNVLMNKDGAIMINNLRRRHVVEEGYFNMRCELYPGCPQWIKWNPTREQNQWFPERTADLFSEKLWDYIFPNRTRNPDFLAQPCCSQFALSRDKIREIPLSQYERLRDWLFETDIGDGYAGRIMEYVWQYLWLDKDEHCPAINECYCKGYGLCLEEEKAQKVIHYNDLRQKMDQQMTVFGNWDKEHCKTIPEGPDKRKCKDGNPFVPPFLQTRKEKMQLEGSLAQEMGIMEP